MAWRDHLRGLGWRILVWMALVALGPLLVMAIQGYHCARQGIIASEAAHLESVLASRRARIEAWVAQIGADLRFLESSPCVRGVCGGAGTDGEHGCAEVCNVLDDLQRGSPAYDHIGSYAVDGRLLAESSGPACCAPPPAGPAQKGPALLGALETAAVSTTLFGSPRYDAGGALVYEVGRRVTPWPASATAFLVARVNASRVLDPILQDRSGLGATGRAHLLTALGAHPREPADPAGRSDGGERELAPGSAVRRYRGARDVAVLGVRSPLPELAAVLVIEIEEREAFAWLRTLRARALATGLVTLAAVLILAARGAHRLAAPLRELAAVARRIAAGRTQERVGSLAGAEAADVGAAVNRMLDELAAIHARMQRQASLAAVGELSASIVHEMRNPLSSIKLNLQALQVRVAGDAAHAELAEIAVAQVGRLETMLTELLSYGRPLSLAPAALTFGPLAAEVARLTRTAAERKGVRLEVEDDLGETVVVADAEQLRRALTNLVTNAVQAAPAEGRVRLVARLTESAGAAAGGARVRIEVLDDGPGIPPAIRARLFEPFFTTRGEGTGLGLAIVRKIAEYHGGAVSAENRPEGGAVFAIELPRGGPAA